MGALVFNKTSKHEKTRTKITDVFTAIIPAILKNVEFENRLYHFRQVGGSHFEYLKKSNKTFLRTGVYYQSGIGDGTDLLFV